MKTSKLLTLAAALAALSYSTAGYAVSVERSDANVAVSFNDSKSFTDIETGLSRSDAAESRVLEEVRLAFQKSAARYLPDGYRLDVVVNDIDLAGDMSPVTSTYGDIRVVTDLYPPRIAFSYAVYGQDDTLVASGEKRLSNLGFIATARPSRFHSSDAAPYVAEMIKDWAARDLRKAVKAN